MGPAYPSRISAVILRLLGKKGKPRGMREEGARAFGRCLISFCIKELTQAKEDNRVLWNCLLILFYKRPAGASAITQITAMLAVPACSTREDPPGNPWVSAISVMKNTGTVPLYIDGISFDLEDASGSLMEENEYSAKGATLQPQSFSFRGIPIGEDRSAGDSPRNPAGRSCLRDTSQLRNRLQYDFGQSTPDVFPQANRPPTRRNVPPGRRKWAEALSRLRELRPIFRNSPGKAAAAGRSCPPAARPPPRWDGRSGR